VHGFGTISWKNRQKSGFSPKSIEAVPKTEVLEQPQWNIYIIRDPSDLLLLMDNKLLGSHNTLFQILE
jgi:hypothetical protein